MNKEIEATENQRKLVKYTHAKAMELRKMLREYRRMTSLDLSPVHDLEDPELLIMAERKLLEACMVMTTLSQELDQWVVHDDGLIQ